MGLAASQARLLSLTARLNDVEFSAQSIEHAKIKLADARDSAYQRYVAALDAQQITGSIMNGIETSKVFATFQNLAGGWENMILPESGTLGYGLVNQKTGKLYVDKEMYEAYNSYKGEDSDEFALQRLGYSSDEIAAFTKHKETKGTFYPLENATTEGASTQIITVNPSSDSYNPSGRYYVASEDGNGYTEVKSMSNYLTTDANGNKVFNESAANLYSELPSDDTRTPNAVIVDYYRMYNELISPEGQYYKNTYEMITLQGGCEELDADLQNNSIWLTDAVANGNVGIYTLSKDAGAERGYKMEMTSTSSSTIINDTAVAAIDKTELKRAEAEYNKELNELKKRDTQFDLALEDLETERNAITTEMDCVKTVMEENAERTFGTFT